MEPVPVHRAEVLPARGQLWDDPLGIRCSQCSLDVAPHLLAVENVGSPRAFGDGCVLHVREVLRGFGFKWRKFLAAIS
jgi:hypothetical protein